MRRTAKRAIEMSKAVSSDPDFSGRRCKRQSSGPTPVFLLSRSGTAGQGLMSERASTQTARSLPSRCSINNRWISKLAADRRTEPTRRCSRSIFNALSCMATSWSIHAWIHACLRRKSKSLNSNTKNGASTQSDMGQQLGGALNAKSRRNSGRISYLPLRRPLCPLQAARTKPWQWTAWPQNPEPKKSARSWRATHHGWRNSGSRQARCRAKRTERLPIAF